MLRECWRHTNSEHIQIIAYLRQKYLIILTTMLRLYVQFLSGRSGRKCFGSHNIFKKLSFIQSVLCSCHAMSRMHCVQVVLSEGNYLSGFEVNGTSQSSAFD